MQGLEFEVRRMKDSLEGHFRIGDSRGIVTGIYASI